MTILVPSGGDLPVERGLDTLWTAARQEPAAKLFELDGLAVDFCRFATRVGSVN
jgi:hypothetical protein